MNNNLVFTYGTLLKGERNHHYLSDEDYICEGCITGYKMFNLGYYPGIEEGDGIVLGELYQVDDETLANLDYLEGEGSLYKRIKTTVYTLSSEYEAYVYVYNHKVLNPLYLGNDIYSWRQTNKEYVWYVSYGSNLLLERFLLYITGGTNKKLNIEQIGCSDKSYPLTSKKTMIQYELYFGNSSKKWNEGGVAFVDETKPGKTYGRAYLITKEHLSEIQTQEGGWYQNKLYLGEIDGIEAYTLTGYGRYPKNTVFHGYEKVITDGLVEIGLSFVEAIKYLKDHQ